MWSRTPQKKSSEKMSETLLDLIKRLQIEIDNLVTENDMLHLQNRELLDALRAYVECANKYNCDSKLKIK